MSPFHWPSGQTGCTDKGCQNNQPLPAGRLGSAHLREAALLRGDNPECT